MQDVTNTRQYLRNYSKTKEGKIKLKKLFKIALNEEDINEIDYWILIYFYAECRMRANIEAKLNMSSTKLATSLNEALIRINFTINKYDKIRNL